ncbi:hypothetical protein RMATCC62417_16653 [Rhizopus microsporus]|nr:hypothetical protein RMATCC62417_16653 [Rhizopus microsporus]
MYMESSKIHFINRLGASSITDLTKRNSVHSTLTGEEQLRSLRERFDPVFEGIVLSDNDDENVKTLEKLARQDVNAARSLSNKYDDIYKGRSTAMFDFYAEQNVSVRGSSGVTESHVFKVDVRAVYDNFAARKSKREADTRNVEILRLDASAGKVTGDKVKLFVESKCVVDRLLSENTPSKDAIVPALQLSGLKAILFSLRLVGSGLYVAVEEDRCSLPTNVNNIKTNLRYRLNYGQ